MIRQIEWTERLSCQWCRTMGEVTLLGPEGRYYPGAERDKIVRLSEEFTAEQINYGFEFRCAGCRAIASVSKVEAAY